MYFKYLQYLIIFSKQVLINKIPIVILNLNLKTRVTALFINKATLDCKHLILISVMKKGTQELKVHWLNTLKSQYHRPLIL